jgi:hypothetical protein
MQLSIRLTVREEQLGPQEVATESMLSQGLYPTGLRFRRARRIQHRPIEQLFPLLLQFQIFSVSSILFLGLPRLWTTYSPWLIMSKAVHL